MLARGRPSCAWARTLSWVWERASGPSMSGSTVGLRLYGEERDTRGIPLIEATNRLVQMAAKPGGSGSPAAHV